MSSGAAADGGAAQLALRAGMTIVRWKNGPQLASDYDAFTKSFAAMSGKPSDLKAARKNFDTHLRNMHIWLARLEEDEEL